MPSLLCFKIRRFGKFGKSPGTGEIANGTVYRARLYRCITGFPSVSEIKPEFPWETVTGVTFFYCNIIF